MTNNQMPEEIWAFSTGDTDHPEFWAGGCTNSSSYMSQKSVKYIRADLIPNTPIVQQNMGDAATREDAVTDQPVTYESSPTTDAKRALGAMCKLGDGDIHEFEDFIHEHQDTIRTALLQTGVEEVLQEVEYILRLTKRDIKNWFPSEEAKAAAIAPIDRILNKITRGNEGGGRAVLSKEGMATGCVNQPICWHTKQFSRNLIGERLSLTIHNGRLIDTAFENASAWARLLLKAEALTALHGMQHLRNFANYLLRWQGV